MTKKAILGNLCWAVVALAAYGVGAMRDKSSAPEQSKGSAAKSGGPVARRTPAEATGGAGGRAARDREVEGGPVARMFPQPKAPRTERELEELAREALKDGNPITRRLAFTRLLESLTPDNAQLLRSYMLEMKAAPDQWNDFHYAWGAIDGEAALKNAMETGEPDMAATMSGWASANPDAARAFLENIPADVKTDREMLKRSLIAGMADRDPMVAADLVYSMANQGEARASEFLGIVTGEVLQTMGVEEASGWSESLPDGAMKGAAMDQVARAYVERDPEAAAAWAGQYAGQDYAVRVIEEVGDEWAKRDPVAAVEWLETLPAGGAQASGIDSAYRRWAYRDAAAAGERLAEMAPSPTRDSAISGFANGLSYRDPVTAIEWADSISQDGLRTSALTRAGQALYRRDANAAREWVGTSGLSPEAQQAVLNPPRRR